MMLLAMTTYTVSWLDASHLTQEYQMKKTVTLTKGINPLSPDIHLQTLHTDLYTFPLRISWENLKKDQGVHFINSYNLFF